MLFGGIIATIPLRYDMIDPTYETVAVFILHLTFEYNEGDLIKNEFSLRYSYLK